MLILVCVIVSANDGVRNCHNVGRVVLRWVAMKRGVAFVTEYGRRERGREREREMGRCYSEG